MPVVVGLDLGTTTLTALALDTDSGEVLGRVTTANTFNVTPPSRRSRGFSEWDTNAIVFATDGCLRQLMEALADRRRDLAGLAVTGQQHGVVLRGGRFINWQDQRGEQRFRRGQTFTAQARELLGESAPARTGCRLATGYLGLTLFWLQSRGKLPQRARASFLPDIYACWLTGKRWVTDPTLAASSGIFDVKQGRWARDLAGNLGIPLDCLPPVRPTGSLLGKVRRGHPWTAELGLPRGLPVFLGGGDNQASFIGSVAQPEESVLVNVGTGGQVSALVPSFRYDPDLESRPFPEGCLLVCAGLSGGRVYALLEGFFRQVGRDLLAMEDPKPLYETLNRLAADVPPGCDGLRCEPYFSGTRQQPERRASWTGISSTNFTPAHLTRALLEGMARTFREGLDRLLPHLSSRPRRLIAAGNGMRENPLLRQLVAEAFGLPLQVPKHREEAAYGAALIAAVGAGIFPDLRAAGKLIRYEE